MNEGAEGAGQVQERGGAGKIVAGTYAYSQAQDACCGRIGEHPSRDIPAAYPAGQ